MFHSILYKCLSRFSHVAFTILQYEFKHVSAESGPDETDYLLAYVLAVTSP